MRALIHMTGHAGRPLRVRWLAVLGVAIAAILLTGCDSAPQVKELVDQGWAFIEEADYKTAAEVCSQAIQLDPRDRDAYICRGEAYRLSGYLRMALGEFSQALSIGPKEHSAYHNRGLTHLMLENYPEALSDFNQAVKLDPDYASTYALRGLAHQSGGNYSAALKDYNAALARQPDLIMALHGRGGLLLELNRYEQAVSDLTRLLELDSTYHAAYAGRGYAYAMLGKKQAAIADLQRFISLGDPNDPVVQDARQVLAALQTPTPSFGELVLQGFLEGFISGSASSPWGNSDSYPTEFRQRWYDPNTGRYSQMPCEGCYSEEVPVR
jgi:tetratricopeptide (TPR) repeat protein